MTYYVKHGRNITYHRTLTDARRTAMATKHVNKKVYIFNNDVKCGYVVKRSKGEYRYGDLKKYVEYSLNTNGKLGNIVGKARTPRDMAVDIVGSMIMGLGAI